MLYVNDTLYTFDPHFERRMIQRHLQVEWVQTVMENPERYELSNTTGNFLYESLFKGYELPFRVIVDEDAKMIITAFFVTPFR